MSALIPENIEELVAEYQRIWPLMPRLHAEASKLADKNAIKACGKRLHLLSNAPGGKRTLVFEDEKETDFFQDYVNYMYQPRGMSLVRQLRNRKCHAAGSDEQNMLELMVHARFSLFWVRELVPVGGVVAVDVVTGEKLFILDQTLPQQEVTGLLIALRVFPFKKVWMHTGAGLPLGHIDDAAGFQPLNCHMSIKEEEQLNRDTFLRWQHEGRDQD